MMGLMLVASAISQSTGRALHVDIIGRNATFSDAKYGQRSADPHVTPTSTDLGTLSGTTIRLEGTNKQARLLQQDLWHHAVSSHSRQDKPGGSVVQDISGFGSNGILNTSGYWRKDAWRDTRMRSMSDCGHAVIVEYLGGRVEESSNQTCCRVS
jgi:hypothetical protein